MTAAKRALGAATATEAIERVLDLAAFQRELVARTVEAAMRHPRRVAMKVTE